MTILISNRLGADCQSEIKQPSLETLIKYNEASELKMEIIFVFFRPIKIKKHLLMNTERHISTLLFFRIDFTLVNDGT